MQNKLKKPLAWAVLAITAALIFVSCSTDKSKNIVFKAEQLYHKNLKHLQTVSLKPELFSDEESTNIKEGFAEIAQYCMDHVAEVPRSEYPQENHDLMSIAFLATNQLTSYYFSTKQYDSAQAVLLQFLTVFEPEDNILLNAKLNLARAYQAQGDLDKALAIHASLLDTFYPPVNNNNEIITDVLNLPLEAVGIFRLIEDTAAMKEMYKNAEDYYNRIKADWPNSDLESAASANLARLYYDGQEWDKSISELNNIKDSTGQVSIEARMMAARITLDGKKDYKKAIALYDDLLNATNDTNIVPTIMTRQGVAYFDLKNYNKCRDIMSEISDKYESYFQTNPIPQQYIAMSFEKMNDWTLAENEYKWLIDNYPSSEEAFDAYLTIASHYEKTGDPNLANTWYIRAEQFYHSIAKKYKNSSIEASAMSYIAEIYRRRQDWDHAVQQLIEIYTKYPNSDVGRRSMVTAAGVYRDKLNEPEKAEMILNRLKAELIPVDDGKNIGVMTDDNK